MPSVEPATAPPGARAHGLLKLAVGLQREDTMPTKTRHDDDEVMSFEQVVAYLNGVADATLAQNDHDGAAQEGKPPACDPPGVPLPSRGTSACLTDVPAVPPSEDVTIGGTPSYPYTRGGARLLDLDPDESVHVAPPTMRYTMPYGAGSVSLAPVASSEPPAWEEAGERPSGVRGILPIVGGPQIELPDDEELIALPSLRAVGA
jgi:hypothetical protein